MSGQVVHFEIPADNLERAQAFYRSTFGWSVNPMPEMSYTLLNTTAVGEDGMPTEPGAINGGMMTRKQPFTNPVIVVAVDDIDTTLREVEGQGGSMVEPKTSVGDMGYSAYFRDTEGNVVGLWQNAG